VGAQTLERLVDALHPAALAEIGRLPLLGHLGGALQAPGLVAPPAEWAEAEVD